MLNLDIKKETKDTAFTEGNVYETLSQMPCIQKLEKNLWLNNNHAIMHIRYSNNLTQAMITSGRGEENIRRIKSNRDHAPIQRSDPFFMDTYNANILGNNTDYTQHPYVACKGPTTKEDVENLFSNVLFRTNSEFKEFTGVVRVGKAISEEESGDFIDYIFPNTQWKKEEKSDSPLPTTTTFAITSELKEGKQILRENSESPSYLRKSPTKNIVTITLDDNGRKQTKTLPVYDIPIKDGHYFTCFSDEEYKKHIAESPCGCEEGTTHISASLLYEIYKLSGEGHIVAHCTAGVGRTLLLFFPFRILDHRDEFFVEGIDSNIQTLYTLYLFAHFRTHRGGAIRNIKQLSQAIENAIVLKKHEDTLAPEQRKKRSSEKLSLSDLKSQIDPLVKAVIVDGLTIEEAILIDAGYLKHLDKWLKKIDEDLTSLPSDDEKENKKEDGIILEKPSYESFKLAVNKLIEQFQIKFSDSNDSNQRITTPNDENQIIKTIYLLIEVIKKSTSKYFDLTYYLQKIEKRAKQPRSQIVIQAFAKVVNTGKRLISINQIQFIFNTIIEENLSTISKKNTISDLKSLETAARNWLNYSAPLIKEASVQALKIFKLLAQTLEGITYSINGYERYPEDSYLQQLNEDINKLKILTSKSSNYNYFTEEFQQILTEATTYYLKAKKSEIKQDESFNSKPFNEELRHALEVHFGDKFEATDLITVSHSTSVMPLFSASSSFSSSYSSYLTTSAEGQRGEVPNPDPLLLTLPSPPVQPETHFEQEIISENPCYITNLGTPSQPTIPNTDNNDKHNLDEAFQVEERSNWLENWNTLTPSMKFLYFLFNFIIFAAAVALITTGIGAVSGAGLLIAALSTELASGIGISFGFLAILGSIWSYQKSLGFAKIAAGVCFIAGLMLLFTGVGGIFTPILLLTSHSLWMGFAIGIGLSALCFNFRFAMSTFLKDVCDYIRQIFTNVPDLPATAGYGAQNAPVPHFVQNHYANTGANNPVYVANVVPATTANVIDVMVMTAEETPSKTV